MRRGRKSAKPRRRALGRRPARKPMGRRFARKSRSSGMPKRQVLQSNLGGLSLTRFSSSRRPNGVAKHIKMTGSPNYLNVTYPGYLFGNGGQQQFSAWYLNVGNDLRRIWASIQSQYVEKNNTYKTEYVASIGNVPIKNASFRYVLETAMSVLNLANTSGTPQNLELYDIVAKRDVGQAGYDISGNPIQGGVLFGQGLPGILDPAVAWYQGMTDQSTTATGFEPTTLESVSPYNLGATPYNSKLFKDYFKVVRKTNVSLPIGGQHKHCVDLKPNFVVDNDLLQQNNVFRGLSFFTLVVASGIPVIKCPSIIEDPRSNPFGDATTSAVSVSIIQQVKYKWTWCEDTRENIYRSNYINSANTNGAQTTQPAMNVLNYSELHSNQTATANGSNFIFTNKPSECTR